MNLEAVAFLNRWWISELLNALLRPMFIRWREAKREGRPHNLFQQRFDRLLFSCDCFPFVVEVDHCGLWIRDEPSEVDYFDDLF